MLKTEKEIACGSHFEGWGGFFCLGGERVIYPSGNTTGTVVLKFKLLPTEVIMKRKEQQP